MAACCEDVLLRCRRGECNPKYTQPVALDLLGSVTSRRSTPLTMGAAQLGPTGLPREVTSDST